MFSSFGLKFCFSVLATVTADILSSTGKDYTDELDDLPSFVQTTSSRSKRSTENSIPSDYNKFEPPPTNSSDPIRVDFTINVYGIHNINERDEELSVAMNVGIHWKDTRLSHLAPVNASIESFLLNPNLLDRIWHPGIYIQRQKSIHESSLASKTASLRIFANGTMRYALRITVALTCPMNFYYYPADTQRCHVDLMSYVYSRDIVALHWRRKRGARFRLYDDLKLSSYDVALNSTHITNWNISGVRFTIILRRKLSYHLIQTYFPSTLFVTISWLSFLAPSETVPLCMSTLLTLIAMFSSIRQTTPNVSYIKALDIWMVVCMIFISFILALYAVAVRIKGKELPPKSVEPTSSTRKVSSAPEQLQFHQPQQIPWATSTRRYSAGEKSNFKKWEWNNNGSFQKHSVEEKLTKEKPLNKYELIARKVEIATSVLIPISFVIFNFIYWPWLLHSAEYYSQLKNR